MHGLLVSNHGEKYAEQICLVIIFCTLPGILVLTLGPAIVTITNAVNPILEGDKP